MRQLLRSEDVQEASELLKNTRMHERPSSLFLLSAVLAAALSPVVSSIVVQAIRVEKDAKETKQALFSLFAAYLHTVLLEELPRSVERARRDAPTTILGYTRGGLQLLSRSSRAP